MRKLVKYKNKISKIITIVTVTAVTVTALLYIAYIIAISLYSYLYNRPIRLCVLLTAIAIVVAMIEQHKTTTNKHKQAHKHRQQQIK